MGFWPHIAAFEDIYRALAMPPPPFLLPSPPRPGLLVFQGALQAAA